MPLKHPRRGKVEYALRYGIFILTSGSVFALRSLRRRYDLVYVHNMPDILVLSALVPKALGAKVVLDLHDPMPELMKTILQCIRRQSKRAVDEAAGEMEYCASGPGRNGEYRVPADLFLAQLPS